MKKGFTIIELLSVIVVIAIISVVAIPTLIGVVNKAKLGALKSSAYGLIEAGNLYNAEYANSNNVRFDINNNVVTTIEENKLKYKGNVKNGTVIVSAKGQVTICITDGKNSAYKNYNDTEVTIVSKKTCTIPSNTYIVYLDGVATRTELSNQELTDELLQLKDEVASLKSNQSSIANKIYPVGSIYISAENTNPSVLFGGTWEKIEDSFMLSSGSYELGTTGGNSSVSYTPQGIVGDHKLTIQEMPSHNHSITINVGWGSGGYGSGAGNASQNNPANLWGASVGYNGGNQPHNHPFTGTTASIQTMPPYIVVNVWKRTA